VLGTIELGYLGPQGTFSEQAAVEFCAKNSLYKLQDFPSIPHVIRAVEKGEIKLGIVPVENSIEGTVNITLDMLVHEVNLFIQGEIILDINHCLLTRKGDVEIIRTIYSHPQALAQCRRFLYKNFPEASYLTTNSTAEAAQIIKKCASGSAAIGSRWAAEKYGLDVYYENVSDYEINQTRFLIIGKKEFSFNKPQKTSLCVALAKNKPGGLYEVLEEFAREQINLTKIESRPAKKELGNYLFFIDCLADLSGEHQHVLQRLKEKCKLVKVLGCYSTLKEANALGYQVK
jgi:prephenate dehydratase